MKFKKIISSILLCTVLASCSDSTPSHEIPLEQSSNCPISTMRTGTERQGIRSYGNGFECTNNGMYFMCYLASKSWLLYADRDSDTIIKLCGRPDCTHSDSDCNAYFNSAAGICYYDGFLYTFTADDNHGKSLVRMNLDGTERVTVYNSAEFEAVNDCKSIVNARIFNGILFFMLMKTDEFGETFYESGYYKLDGSMDEPKIDTFMEMFVAADGENIIAPVYDKENDLYIYGIWEPENGMVSELFRTDDIISYKYIGAKATYYVENGIIIEDSYTEGKKELINTGLKGDYQLACFPDCMVMYEKNPSEEKILYFYDWNYNSLGSVKINYEFHNAITGFICGETPERIFLTDNLFYTPRYYINKSDFGTGNIEIHALNVPDFGEE